MTNELSILVDKIKAATGLNQGEISKKAGYEETYFSQLLNGAKKINKKVLEKVNLVFSNELALEKGKQNTLEALKDAKGTINTLSEPSPPYTTPKPTDQDRPPPDTNTDSLNRLIQSNQMLAEANKDLAAGHKMLAEMLLKATGGVLKENVSNLNALVVGMQAVLLQVATGKRFSTDLEVMSAMHKADGKSAKAETADIQNLADTQSRAS